MDVLRKCVCNLAPALVAAARGPGASGVRAARAGASNGFNSAAVAGASSSALRLARTSTAPRLFHAAAAARYGAHVCDPADHDQW